MSGTLYGIGVGPGDPELITLKALNLLTSAKVISYPAPDNGESSARAIVAKFIPSDAIELPIVIPMRVERFPAQNIYDRAAETLGKHLSRGRDVVMLCEGDPFFYGSFMYVFARLSRQFNVEIIPGVSSLMAASAQLGQPLAARNDVLTILPAPLECQVLRDKISKSDAVALIKIGRHFARVRALIEDMGLMNQAAYLERATLPNQKLMPLVDVPVDQAPYFSIILIYKGAENWITPIKSCEGTAAE